MSAIGVKIGVNRTRGKRKRLCQPQSRFATLPNLTEVVAEGVGFEPTVGFNTYSGLANPCTCKMGTTMRREETQYS